MWSHDKLWKKSKNFIELALDTDDRNSPLFPFWCALSIELLARASLAKVHSALLADAQQNGDNVLFACGIQGVKSPKSIGTKTVFLRCNRVIEQFTEADYKFCMLLMEKRNEELHTGASPFEGWPHAEWLPEFYRISGKILDFIDKSMDDYLGKKEAKTAKKMISALLTNKKDEAFKIIKQQKESFLKLPVIDRLEKIKKSISLRRHDFRGRNNSKNIKCPACEGSARIIGELVRSSTPRDDNGELIQEDFYLPDKLKCYSCELLIKDYNYLHGIGLGEPFQKRDVLDPVDYYDIDPNEYMEEPY